LDAKGQAIAVEAHVPSAPIVAVGKTHADHRGAGPGRYGFSPGAVAIDEKLAIGRQELGQRAFLPGDSIGVAEELKVFTADRSDYSVTGLDHADQRGQFARVVGSNLQHRGSVFTLKLQKRQRDANVVVETGLAPQ